MKRSILIALAAAFVGVGCGGDAGADAESETGDEAAEQAAAATGESQEAGFPEGWQIRTDDGETSPEAVELSSEDDALHVAPGPRAIYWNPDNRAEAPFRVRATFVQTEDPGAPESYGLFVGGRDLTDEGQDYLYFHVRGSGEFLVKHRAGSETHTLVDWTEHEAVSPADDAGRQENTLVIEAPGEGVRFLVNGEEVTSLPASDMLNTDGLTGFRVNHRLDVLVRDFEVESLEQGG